MTSQFGGNITFASTVDGTFALTVNTAGVTAFFGPVGGAIALASLTTDAPGETDLNGGVVSTIGPQTYNDPVFLTTETVLISQLGGDITFGNTVDWGLCADGLCADREYGRNYGVQRPGRRCDSAGEPDDGRARHDRSERRGRQHDRAADL